MILTAVSLLRITVSTMTLLKIVSDFFRMIYGVRIIQKNSHERMEISMRFTQMLITIMTM